MGWLALLVAGCGGGWNCVEVDDTCAPLYEPTFDNVYTNTLQPTCGVAGGGCHSSEGAQAGLVFDDPDDAYEALTAGDSPIVTPGDPSCSLLIIRLEQSDPDDAMPPGSPLDAAERCAVAQWVAAGASR